MAYTDGIDLSSLGLLIEFATGNCIAAPSITINGTGLEYAPTPEWATGPCLAPPSITINGTGLEYAPPTHDYGGSYTVSSPSRTMVGIGVVRYASARAVVPGDNAQEVGIGFTVDFTASPRRVKVRRDVTFREEVFGPEVESWLWHYGDGETGTTDPSTHRYAAKGLYTIKLEVWTFGGEYGSIEKNAYVTVTPRNNLISYW